MIHTRYGAMTNQTSMRRGNHNVDMGGDREGDPLIDIVSYVPAKSAQSGQEESSRFRDDDALLKRGMLQSKILNRDEHENLSPPTVPAIVPPPYPNPVVLA
jgi:hypothetical protein